MGHRNTTTSHAGEIAPESQSHPNDGVALARLLINAGADPGARITRRKPPSPPAPETAGEVHKVSAGVPRIPAESTERAAKGLTSRTQSGARAAPAAQEEGMTPLHLACRAGRAELAGYLIRVGATVSATTLSFKNCEASLFAGKWFLRDCGSTPGNDAAYDV